MLIAMIRISPLMDAIKKHEHSLLINRHCGTIKFNDILSVILSTVFFTWYIKLYVVANFFLKLFVS